MFSNNQICTERWFTLQTFSEGDYLGRFNDIYFTAGFSNLPFAANSYVWFRGGLGCRITFCANLTLDVGFRCNNRYQPNASAGFPRVYIWYGVNVDMQSAECS
jgi:hypothetical protein